MGLPVPLGQPRDCREPSEALRFTELSSSKLPLKPTGAFKSSGIHSEPRFMLCRCPPCRQPPMQPVPFRFALQLHSAVLSMLH